MEPVLVYRRERLSIFDRKGSLEPRDVDDMKRWPGNGGWEVGQVEPLQDTRFSHCFVHNQVSYVLAHFFCFRLSGVGVRDLPGGRDGCGDYF